MCYGLNPRISEPIKNFDDVDKEDGVWLFLILKKSIAKARKIHSISTLIYITPFMLRTNTCFLSAVNKGLHISILSRDRGVGIYVGGTIEQENKKPHPF